MKEIYLVLRSYSGLSGDMLLTGLARLAGFSERLGELAAQCGLEAAAEHIEIHETMLNGISGWKADIRFKEEHSHRNLTDIQKVISESCLSSRAKEISRRAFQYLAEAEGMVHRLPPEAITFHEIGALDSILDVCLSAALFDKLSPSRFISSPLPICDGSLKCRHGILPAPPPASLLLLKDIPVYGIPSTGETVTPTALALLKALDAEFDKWPPFVIKEAVRVYGSRFLPDVPNGAVFTLGVPFDRHVLLQNDCATIK